METQEVMIDVAGLGQVRQKDTHFTFKDATTPERPCCKNFAAHPDVDYRNLPYLVARAVFSPKLNKEFLAFECPGKCKDPNTGMFFKQPYPTDLDIAILIRFGYLTLKYARFMKVQGSFGLEAPPVLGPIAVESYFRPSCAVCHEPLTPKVVVSQKEASKGQEFLMWDCKGKCKTDDGQWVKHPFVKDRDIDNLGPEFERFRRTPKTEPVKSTMVAHEDEVVVPDGYRPAGPLNQSSVGHPLVGSKRKATELPGFTTAAELIKERDERVRRLHAEYNKRIDALVNDEINAQ